MSDSRPPALVPSTAQVVSACVQNVAAIGAVSFSAYSGKIDATVACVIIAAIAGLDLAKVKNLKPGSALAATLGATGIAQWIGRVG